MTATLPSGPIRWRSWLLAFIAVATVYALVPQLGVFHLSWQVLRWARWPFVMEAVGFTALTFVAAATNYVLLAFRRVRYGRTLLMQLASTFANRLLPAGIGGMGANYAYLRKMRHTTAQAASTVAVNNLLGFVGHCLVVAIVVLFQHQYLGQLHVPVPRDLLWLAVLLIVLTLIALGIGRRRRHDLAAGFRQTIRQLASYRHRPGRLAAALAASIGLTLCNVAAFYNCVVAFGIHQSFMTVVLVFTLGIVIGTVTPTPGGLGGTEAALTAGLVAFRVADGTALAATLLYRLVSYWLPLLIGAGAFVIADRRHYF